MNYTKRTVKIPSPLLADLKEMSLATGRKEDDLIRTGIQDIVDLWHEIKEGEVNNRLSWITLREAALRLPERVTHHTVNRWLKKGKWGIVAKKLGGTVYVRADTLPEMQDYIA